MGACAMSNTHRQRRRNSTVELSRVSNVNAPVGSRDPVFNLDLKISRLTDVERSSVGNEFHTVGADTQKLLVPSFVREPRSLP